MSVIVGTEFEFAAAHHLPNYDGKCKELHGHNYRVILEVEGDIDPVTKMVIDFSKLKELLVKEIMKRYDHKYLNDMWYNAEPTVEFLVEEMWKELSSILCGRGLAPHVSLYSLKIYETSGCYAYKLRKE